MLVLMQIIGGSLFFLNKVFFSFAERTEKKYPDKRQTWRIFSWIVYILGLPAWIVIFIHERNWIAAALEIGGLPSMIMGIFLATKVTEKSVKWIDGIALLAIVLGLGYSLYDFGGVTKITQVFELTMTAGFLIGTYLIAKKQLSGYLWYISMNLSCAMLMYCNQQDDYVFIIILQLLSIVFVFDAYRTKKSKTTIKADSP